MIINTDFNYYGKNRPLHIYLPDDYYEKEYLNYPVMYFFDGHNLFYDKEATYGKCWGLLDFMNQYDKQFIIVGMECGHVGDERMDEYLPYNVTNAWLSEFDAKGKETWEWILNEVKPYIDKEYRTIPFRECTAIAGSSMGGLMSLYGVINYNRYFSKAACLSSSIMTCMNDIIYDIQKKLTYEDTKVYLSWGSGEAVHAKNKNENDTSSWTYVCNNIVKEEIEKKGANCKMYCQVGGQHCEADWEKQNSIYMDYLWK